MEIVYKGLGEIMPYEDNPRHNDGAVSYVASSIKEFGFKVPIVIDAAGVIVCGHTRYKAAKSLGMEEVPCVVADDLTPYQIAAFRLADNKVSEYSDWDFSLLEKELDEIGDMVDMEDFGFDFEGFGEDVPPPVADAPENRYSNGDENKGNLFRRYIQPPFSVLNANSGQWRERKEEWLSLGIKSEEGRDDALIGRGLKELALARNPETTLTGTSVFDPVLCELAYRWFNLPGGKVYDCFAGGSVRGVIAEMLGYTYTGIELRERQVEANRENAADLGVSPTWICDDSKNADQYLEDGSVDFIFTCPPYADLEVYSDDPRDISNMDFDGFMEAYGEILSTAARKLKDDRFAVIVISDVRDKNGVYRLLPERTMGIMLDNGFSFYNDIVLYNSLATAPLRANTSFQGWRKTVRVHQRVLVFYKGDPKKIKENFPALDLSGTEFGEEWDWMDGDGGDDGEWQE